MTAGQNRRQGQFDDFLLTEYDLTNGILDPGQPFAGALETVEGLLVGFIDGWHA